MGHYSVHADRLWVFLSQAYPQYGPSGSYPVVTSLMYYSFTLLMALNLRAASGRCLPAWLHIYVGDMITAFSTCACSLENMMVRLHHGYTGYATIMFSLAMWSFFVAGDYSGNPCSVVVRYMQGKIHGKQAVGRIVFQVIGGLSSFRYAHQYWSMGLTNEHTMRYEHFEKLYCTSDLSVSPLIGFGIEFGCTFIDAFLMLTALTSFHILEAATKIFLGVMAVVAGVHLTGMYWNPVNASTQTFGCHGTSKPIHVFIYWVGPLTASALAVFLKSRLERRIKSAVAGQNSSKINGLSSESCASTDVMSNSKAVNGLNYSPYIPDSNLRNTHDNGMGFVMDADKEHEASHNEDANIYGMVLRSRANKAGNSQSSNGSSTEKS